MKLITALRLLYTGLVRREIPVAVTVKGKTKFVKGARNILLGESPRARDLDLMMESIEWRGLVILSPPPAEGGPFFAMKLGDEYVVADMSKQELERERTYLVVKPDSFLGKLVYVDEDIAVFETQEGRRKIKMTQLVVAGQPTDALRIIISS